MAYVITQSLFFKGLGAVHFFAFLSIFQQVPVLLGAQGLYPYEAVIQKIPSEAAALSFSSVLEALLDGPSMYRFAKYWLVGRVATIEEPSMAGEMGL